MKSRPQTTKQISRTHQCLTGYRAIGSLRPAKVILTCSLVAIMANLLANPSVDEGRSWWFGGATNVTPGSADQQVAARQSSRQLEQKEATLQGAVVQEEKTSQSSSQSTVSETGAIPAQSAMNYGSYGSSLLSIAGIQPSSIATVLNTVGDTGFKYFNIHDQCRNRAACDLGYMLFKRLSFVHNWLVRTSVRTLVDMNNVYAQSWMEGMLGKNCTAIYTACRQSPLEGFMNLAMLQRMVM